MIESYERDGSTVLELAHGKANALDIELCSALIDRVDALRRDGSPPFILTATGRIFSAGVDLKRLLGGGEDYVREFVPLLARCIRVLFEYPGPVVSAINGHAVAGGCILACAADRRIMADGDARVGIPELRVGVPFPAAAIEVMRSTLSPARFRGLVYGGATLDARAAVHWGLIDELSPPDSLMDAAVKAAKNLGRIPGGAFRVTKAQLRLPALQRIDAAEVVAGDHVVSLWAAPETLAAVRRYVERTLGGSA
jgi:enoyl-CoA hydratase